LQKLDIRNLIRVFQFCNLPKIYLITTYRTVIQVPMTRLWIFEVRHQKISLLIWNEMT
jgi:hypothetical protein